MKKVLLMLFLFCSLFAFGQTLDGVNEEHLVVSDTAKILKNADAIPYTDTILNTSPQIGTPRQTKCPARNRRVQKCTRRCSNVKLFLYGGLVYLVNAFGTDPPPLLFPK